MKQVSKGPPFIEYRNYPNHIIARRVRDGEIVAEARRVRLGALWRVWYRGKAWGGLNGDRCHASVSGQLPEHVQYRMVSALLEAACKK